MKVEGINPAQVAVQTMKNTSTPQEDNPIGTETPEVIENAESEEKTTGVIALLQAGHFKGVADVRLRINFYDEIQALEAQNLKETASNGIDEFDGAVQEEINALNESGLLNEDQTAALDVFLANLQNTQTDFLKSGDSSVQSLVNGLQADLDLLMALLNPPALESLDDLQTSDQEIVTEDEASQVPLAESLDKALVQPEPLDEGVIPDAAESQEEPSESTEESDPLQQLVLNFQQNVQTFIDTLRSNLSDTSVLPPVSEPSGNGKAYAKFMTIYESMLSGSLTNVEQTDQFDIKEVPDAEEDTTIPETPELS